MRRAPFVIILALTFLLEAAALVYFTGRIEERRQDPVKINECVRSIEENFGNEDSYSGSLDYVILGNDGHVLYRTKEGLPETINEAVAGECVMLDINVDGDAAGKVIFGNDTAESLSLIKRGMVTVFVSLSAVQLAVILFWFLYVRKTVLKPFEEMNSFASRVAEGNLDIPLPMDRRNAFGAFTEAFDLMRSELKKAREAEKKANDDKKETIAKLSHDIKTPVASIKSASEVGYELAKDDGSREKFNLINVKSDQITTLVDNLFNSSIREITEIAVNPGRYESGDVADLIRNADYLGKSGSFSVPECMVYIDKLRLQQVLDNIFMNSYKYAGTPIETRCLIAGDYLVIRIADRGPGVKPEELPLLKEKYKRGSNIEGRDGAGLGLYLADYFLLRMEGRLELSNLDPGFEAAVFLRIAA